MEVTHDWAPYLNPTGQCLTLTPSLQRMAPAIALSPALTVIDAYRMLRLEPASFSPQMLIHILGDEENTNLHRRVAIFEEIMHQLPAIRDLAVEFIGLRSGSEALESGVPQMVCPACRYYGRRMAVMRSP